MSGMGAIYHAAGIYPTVSLSTEAVDKFVDENLSAPVFIDENRQAILLVKLSPNKECTLKQ
jgi:hypothetical protein